MKSQSVNQPPCLEARCISPFMFSYLVCFNSDELMMSGGGGRSDTIKVLSLCLSPPYTCSH